MSSRCKRKPDDATPEAAKRPVPVSTMDLTNVEDWVLEIIDHEAFQAQLEHNEWLAGLQAQQAPSPTK